VISAARAAASMSPPLDYALDIEVVAPLLVDQVAAAVHVARRIDHRVEHLEIDANRIGEVFRLTARGGDAGGNRLADIARFVGGKRRPSRSFGPGRMRGYPDRFDAQQIGCSKHVAA